MKTKKPTCVICGEPLTYKKKGVSQYCNYHNPRKAWDRLNARFTNADHESFKKMDCIHFNISYELIRLKKILEDYDTKAKPDKEFISVKLKNILDTLIEVSEEINGKVDKKCI